MEIKRYMSAQEFLDDTSKFRADDLVKTNLISSIATSVAIGTRKYNECFWWAVVEGNEIVGIAIRTAPFGYVLSPMSPKGAELLFNEISKLDVEADEISGPKAVIDHIAKSVILTVLEDEGELVYQLTSLLKFPKLGDVRAATNKDFDLVLNWFKDFIDATKIRAFNTEEVVKSNIEKELLFILEVAGVPVSLGGYHLPLEFFGKKISRIGPVYTPKEFRKNGYASVITAYLTDKILNLNAIATLYTQANNPTSNKIYQELGYVLVDEIRRIKYKK